MSSNNGRLRGQIGAGFGGGERTKGGSGEAGKDKNRFGNEEVSLGEDEGRDKLKEEEGGEGKDFPRGAEGREHSLGRRRSR